MDNIEGQNDQEIQDSTPDEELDSQNQDTEGDGDSDGEVDWKAKAEELENKNKQLFARLKKQPKEVEKPKEEKVEKTTIKDELAATRAELQEIRLQQANSSLSSAQVKKAIAYAKAEGVEPQDLIKSDFFQAYIAKEAEKNAERNSAPNPSNRSGSTKSNFESMTDEQLAQFAQTASPEEWEKYDKWATVKSGNKGGIIVRHRIAT